MTEWHRWYHGYEKQRGVNGPVLGSLVGSMGQRLTGSPGEQPPMILGVTEVMDIRKMHFTFFKLIRMCGTEQTTKVCTFLKNLTRTNCQQATFLKGRRDDGVGFFVERSFHSGCYRD